MRKEERASRRRLVRVPAMAAAALVLLWSAWSAGAYLLDLVRQEAVLTALQSYAAYQAPRAEPEAAADKNAPEQAFTGTVYTVDFPGLREINPDICGWIRIPGTGISQPVVQGQDDAFYLDHAPDRSENRAGSLFLRSGTKSDFSEVNSVIYGHRMNNGTMFAPLHAYEDAAFREAHPYICLSTPTGEIRYRIFEVAETDASLVSPAYRTSFADGSAVRAWGSEPAGDLLYAFTDPQLGAESRVLTLSTCVQGNGSRRFIVRAAAL